MTLDTEKVAGIRFVNIM